MQGSLFNFWFLFGLLIAAAGVFVLFGQFILRRHCTETATGFIEAGNFRAKEAALLLRFSVNGKEYHLPFVHSHKMSVGDTVTVAYNPSNINRHSCYVVEDVPNIRAVSLICLAGGLVFMLIGYGVAVG